MSDPRGRLRPGIKLGRVLTVSAIFLLTAPVALWLMHKGLSRGVVVPAYAVTVLLLIRWLAPGMQTLGAFIVRPIEEDAGHRHNEEHAAMSAPPVVAKTAPALPRTTPNLRPPLPRPRVDWATATGPHGAVEVVAGRTRYGRYEYDEAPRTITNFLSGQRLVVNDQARLEADVELDCEFHDPVLTQPVAFSLQIEWTGSAFSLRLDYRRLFPTIPVYGLWRRVDDFLNDALRCWPEHVFCNSSLTLTMVGGWQSGGWQPKLERTFTGGRVAGLSRTDEHPGQNLTRKCPVSSPCLIPLDAQPLRWRFVNHDLPEKELTLPFRHVEGQNIPYLDPSESPPPFKDHIPHLEREDGKAWLLLTSLEPTATGPDATPITNLWFTYLDERLFFTFRCFAQRQLELWYCRDYGTRQLPLTEDLWPADVFGAPIPGDSPTLQPRRPGDHVGCFLSHRVWQQLVTTFVNAWPLHLPVGTKAFSILDYHGLELRNGFSAGMAHSGYSLRVSRS